MAAPTPTARVTPVGLKMPDGYRSLVTFSKNAYIQLWERQVKPPGIDGGQKIETTTMHNTAYRTAAARHLKTLDDANMMCAYDPDAITDLLALINDDTGSVTFLFPDASTWCAWGYLGKIEFGDLKEGEFPEATVTIFITNYDKNGGVEAAPVFTPGTGT